MAEREWKYQNVDLSTNITTITAVACLVRGWTVTTALSPHACPIKDSTTTVWTVPSGAQVGDTFGAAEGVRFENSLIVDPDDSATGKVTLFYRVLNEL